MGAATIFVYIFAIIGLFILIYYAINWLVNVAHNRKIYELNKRINPPYAYMQNGGGIKCPDYFSSVGGNKGSYVCSNRDFNIAINDSNGSGQCYTDQTDKTMKFPAIPEGKTWELGNPNGLTTMTEQDKWDFVRTKIPNNFSRCEWIENCGPSNGIDAVWQGVNEFCNMSDPSQSQISAVNDKIDDTDDSDD